ncbi:hypothetical protein [Amycolatopsis pigmentata]|uniref:PE family protein n=1 Tax=Amycolatopsis pigmentata TaxID=450801 RepID=A0ABW5FQK9_9PSEU
MSWWDDVSFVVTGEESNAVKGAGQAIGQAGQAIGQNAAGAVLGQAGFGGPADVPAGASAVTSGGGSAGTIRMSREEMEDTLKRAQDLLKEITDQLRPAERLTQIQAPAKDPASLAATGSANNAGTYYVGHLRRQQAYLNKVVSKIAAALNITVQTDEGTAGAVGQAGKGAFG